MPDHHAFIRHFGGQFGPIGGSVRGQIAINAPSNLSDYTEQSRLDGELIMREPGNSTAPAPSTTSLEQLAPGVRVSGGPLGESPLEVVAVKWYGANFITLTYRTDRGTTGELVLGRLHEAQLRLHTTGRSHAFDGDGESWRLGAEALRIRNAALFDPMLAVAASDLEPLPHQIKAVYEELLPRTPLRFLLADDPGSGKTIMAGLYAKELMLRGDLARCLIVVPGGLVEQWQGELYEKFGLTFELLTRSLVESTIDTSVFERYPLLIARMDQLARNEDLLAQLEASEWDLVVVDEAHRMSAHYFGAELKRTRRYQLGQLLGRLTRHLLLMTATPHAGKQEDFQLFLALLDGDRFEGRNRDGAPRTDPRDLMRRMVKEELLTMDGRPLFPERHAYTLSYDLSKGETELYDEVTRYVRDEMNRVDRLKEAGENRRGNTVGFALTVLQRRLASSPEAILRSLERRRLRLGRRRRELDEAAAIAEERSLRRRIDDLVGEAGDRAGTDADYGIDEQLSELASAELEAFEDEVVDAASAAQTIAELDREVTVLGDLAKLAQEVRDSATDRKWSELQELLQRNELLRDAGGQLRKVIVFTEHRDTLTYLIKRIGDLLGSSEVVEKIHGGMARDARRRAQERFTQDRDVRVLVATDAAGEGLNLQRAHLMINYDLPWNPNRIEQRFGRIHRIGQTEVCHLWNLVAVNTREGEVFQRLLTKLEQQRQAYRGKVFDVLGEAFVQQSLPSLLLQAIRYGDRPEVRARLNQQIDATVGDGLDQLIKARALHRDVLAAGDVAQLRNRLDDAQVHRLQPHYIEAFFLTAFARLGGRVSARESGRYEVPQVPLEIRDRSRQSGTGQPTLARYERVTFGREPGRRDSRAPADLLAPGHPLLESVVSLTIARHQSALKQGAVLVDRRDPGDTPRLLVALTHDIHDGHSPPRVVSRRFDFVELTAEQTTRPTGPAPYLDYDRAGDAEATAAVQALAQSWLANWQDTVVSWYIQHSLPQHLAEVEEQILPEVARVREQVQNRLLAEIQYEDARHADLLAQEAAGRQPRSRPDTAYRRARDLERRLGNRLAELDADARLAAQRPAVAGGALVVPQGLLDRLGVPPTAANAVVESQPAEPDRRHALEAVLAAERALGRTPEVQLDAGVGYDIRSASPDGHGVRIKIELRPADAEHITVARSDVLAGKNLGDHYRLALVDPRSDRPAREMVRYLVQPFDGLRTTDLRVSQFRLNWSRAWTAAGAPR